MSKQGRLPPLHNLAVTCHRCSTTVGGEPTTAADIGTVLGVRSVPVPAYEWSGDDCPLCLNPISDPENYNGGAYPDNLARWELFDSFGRNLGVQWDDIRWPAGAPRIHETAEPPYVQICDNGHMMHWGCALATIDRGNGRCPDCNELPRKSFGAAYQREVDKVNAAIAAGTVAALPADRAAGEAVRKAQNAADAIAAAAVAAPAGAQPELSVPWDDTYARRIMDSPQNTKPNMPINMARFFAGQIIGTKRPELADTDVVSKAITYAHPTLNWMASWTLADYVLASAIFGYDVVPGAPPVSFDVTNPHAQRKPDAAGGRNYVVLHDLETALRLGADPGLRLTVEGFPALPVALLRCGNDVELAKRITQLFAVVGLDKLDLPTLGFELIPDYAEPLVAATLIGAGGPYNRSSPRGQALFYDLVEYAGTPVRDAVRAIVAGYQPAFPYAYAMSGGALVMKDLNKIMISPIVACLDWTWMLPGNYTDGWLEYCLQKLTIGLGLGADPNTSLRLTRNIVDANAFLTDPLFKARYTAHRRLAGLGDDEDTDLTMLEVFIIFFPEQTDPAATADMRVDIVKRMVSYGADVRYARKLAYDHPDATSGAGGQPHAAWQKVIDFLELAYDLIFLEGGYDNALVPNTRMQQWTLYEQRQAQKRQAAMAAAAAAAAGLPAPPPAPPPGVGDGTPGAPPPVEPPSLVPSNLPRPAQSYTQGGANVPPSPPTPSGAPVPANHYQATGYGADLVISLDAAVPTTLGNGNMIQLQPYYPDDGVPPIGQTRAGYSVYYPFHKLQVFHTGANAWDVYLVAVGAEVVQSMLDRRAGRVLAVGPDAGTDDNLF